MKLRTHWIIIVACALVILIAGFVYFRNDSQVVFQQTKSDTIELDVTSEESGRHPASVQGEQTDGDATLGEMLPYLATPHGR